MAQDVRFIILNDDEEFGAQARSALLKIDGIKIVAEVDEPALLGQAVVQFPIDIVLANLDPAPESVLPIVGDVVAANPDLAVFASSASTDGHLILKVMRLGIKEFFPQPLDESALREAVGKIADCRVANTSQGKLFTIMGAAGGVGSTLLTTNLAVRGPTGASA